MSYMAGTLEYQMILGKILPGPSHVLSSSSISFSSSLLTLFRDLRGPREFSVLLGARREDVSHHSPFTLPFSLFSLLAKFERSLKMGSRSRAVYNG